MPVDEYRTTVPSGSVSAVVADDFTFQIHSARLPTAVAVTVGWVCAPAENGSVAVATPAGATSPAPD